MLNLTIDGIAVRVAEGVRLLDAASGVGIKIPALCHHPGLTPTAQCRTCLVEVEGSADLVTACATTAQEGMVVHTNSERVEVARNGVFELLLANHPLECPVCDQSGECGLQEQTPLQLQSSTARRLPSFGRRKNAGSDRRTIGPRVLQNHNRCIHCSCCIRVFDEVFETHDLQMSGRGEQALVDTFPGQPFDNPWSVCAADVCPVGALTAQDFRFQQPVWRLTVTQSVCPGCSIGCNIIVGHRDGVVYRFLPRPNREINGWWMCDHGRTLYDRLNGRDIIRPLASAGDDVSPLEWASALDMLSERISDLRPKVIASANLSNEGLFLVKKLLGEALGLAIVVPVESRVRRRIKNGRGSWIESQDEHANTTGVPTVDAADLEGFVAKDSVLVLDNRATEWLCTNRAAQSLAGRLVAAFGRRHTPLSHIAPLVLPAASWLETEGTFTSSTGRVQIAQKGLDSLNLSLPNWKILSDLGVRLGVFHETYESPRAVFEELVARAPAFAGMTYLRLRSEPGTPALLETKHAG